MPSTVFTADQIAAILAERAPGLGEAQTVAILESLLASRVIGADASTPIAFIERLIDKEASAYRIAPPVDAAVALDEATRAHLVKAFGENWRSRYTGADLRRIWDAAQAIVKEKTAPPVNREQEYLDKLQHRDELTPTERLAASYLKDADERAKGAAPAKAATVSLPSGDAVSRLNSANRNNSIARLSLELSSAKMAITNHRDNRNLVSYAEQRVTTLTSQLESLGVVVK